MKHKYQLDLSFVQHRPLSVFIFGSCQAVGLIAAKYLTTFILQSGLSPFTNDAHTEHTFYLWRIFSGHRYSGEWEFSKFERLIQTNSYNGEFRVYVETK